MAKIKQTHERHQHTIKDLSTGKRKPHESVNAAKRASRTIQLANGGLGMDSVSVAK